MKGQTFLVVNGVEGVIGTYFYLEKAKYVLNEMNVGKKIRLEVNVTKNLVDYPTSIGGEKQDPGKLNRFSRHWCSWICMTKLNWNSRRYLENPSSMCDK